MYGSRLAPKLRHKYNHLESGDDAFDEDNNVIVGNLRVNNLYLGNSTSISVDARESSMTSSSFTSAISTAANLNRTGHKLINFNGYLYLLYGLSSGISVLRSSDLGSNWTDVSPSAPTNRHRFGAIAFGGKMWIFFGTTIGSNTPLNDVWSTTDGITWVQEAATVTNLTGRYNFSLLKYNNKLWIIGGRYGSADASIYKEVYNSPDGVNWTLVTATPTTLPLLAECGHVVFASLMWIVGGTASDGTYTQIAYSSPDGVTWTSRSTAVLAGSPADGIQGATLLKYNGKLVLIGGTRTGPIDNTNIAVSSDGVTWTVNSAAAPSYSSSTSIVIGNKIIITGAMAGSPFQSLYRSAVDTNLSVLVPSSLASSSTSTGALVVTGGLGVGGATNINGITRIYDTTNGTYDTLAATFTGSLLLGGGAYITKDVVIASATPSTNFTLNNSYGTGALAVQGGVTAGGIVRLFNGTASTDYLTGSLIVGALDGGSAGLGVSGNINSGGYIKSALTTDSSSTSTGAIITAGGLGVAKLIYTGSGIRFPNAGGGTATTLDTHVYHSMTLTFSCGSGTGGTTAAVTAQFEKIGRTVVMYLPSFTLTSKSIAGDHIEAAESLPTYLQPILDGVLGGCRVTNAGTLALGFIYSLSNKVSIYRDGGGSTFTAAATVGNINNSFGTTWLTAS
jgi:hypothetical protein